MDHWTFRIRKNSNWKRNKKNIIKNYGPTILFSGDDIRNIFDLKKYSFKDRLKIVKQYGVYVRIFKSKYQCNILCSRFNERSKELEQKKYSKLF